MLLGIIAIFIFGATCQRTFEANKLMWICCRFSYPAILIIKGSALVEILVIKSNSWLFESCPIMELSISIPINFLWGDMSLLRRWRQRRTLLLRMSLLGSCVDGGTLLWSCEDGGRVASLTRMLLLGVAGMDRSSGVAGTEGPALPTWPLVVPNAPRYYMYRPIRESMSLWGDIDSNSKHSIAKVISVGTQKIYPRGHMSPCACTVRCTWEYMLVVLKFF